MHIMPYHDDLMIFFFFYKNKSSTNFQHYRCIIFFLYTSVEISWRNVCQNLFPPCTRVERPGAYHDQIGIQHEKFGTFTAHYCLG